MKKTKKLIKFWKQWENSIIDKGVRAQIKCIKRRYNKQRAKSTEGLKSKRGEK